MKKIISALIPILLIIALPFFVIAIALENIRIQAALVSSILMLLSNTLNVIMRSSEKKKWKMQAVEKEANDMGESGENDTNPSP